MSLALENERPRLNPFVKILTGEAAIGIAILLLLVAVAFLSLSLQKPPATVSAGAPPTEFASGRAMKHVEAVAQKPHPMGSVEHVAVRDYILRSLQEIGVGAEIQNTTVISRKQESSLRVGSVNNVVARLKGTEAGKAILLAAHYDSVPNSPGASDDGAGVAALLETARALKAGTPLKNDIIFLFTDGEEVGLLGAKGFVEEHPWAKDVAVALNFEARGNGGSSLMFETSRENGWLIREFAGASPHPVANSLTYEIYKLMPNDTDLSVFKEAGYAGLNFAFIDGLPHYHSSTDDIASLDERSLQHHGSNALALARYFGNLNLAVTKENDSVYFDVMGLFLVRYSTAWVVPLTILVTLLFVGVVLMGIKRGKLASKGMGLGFLALLFSAVSAYAVVTLAWWLLQLFYTRYSSMPQWLKYNRSLYLLSFIALAMASASVIYIFFRKRVSILNLVAGALGWWLILLILSAIYLPGASYVLLWPLVFGLLGLLLALVSKESEAGAGPRILSTSFYLSLFAIPGIILVVPLIPLVFTGLGLEWSAALMVVVVLLLGLIVPHLNLLSGARKWMLPGGLAVAALAVITLNISTAAFDKNHPKPDHLFYGVDAMTGKSVWASFDGQPDGWTGQVFAAREKGTLSEFQVAGSGKYLKSNAPSIGLAPPEVTVLEDSTDGDLRKLRLHVTSLRQAPFINLQLNSNAELRGVVINGKRLEYAQSPLRVSDEKRWGLRYYALPPEGMDLSLEVKSSEPLKFSVLDQSYGLPQIPGAPLQPRPDDTMPASAAYSDATLVSKNFVF
jgi:hypothetical protein